MIRLISWSGRAVLAMLTSLALVFGVSVTAVAIDFPEPVPDVTEVSGDSALVVTPLESEELAQPLSAPVVADVESPATPPVDDGLPDGDAKSSFDPKTSEVVERGADFDTYLNADGTNTTVLSLGPSNVQDDKGTWVPIETDVSVVESGGAEVADHPLAPEFAPTANDGVVLTTTSGEYSMSFGLEGASGDDLKSASTVDAAALREETPDDDNTSVEEETPVEENQVAYDEVFPGVSLKYSVERTHIQEVLELAEAPTEAPVYRWSVESAGLSLKMNDFGDYNFVDEKGVVRFSIPAPVMWDSSAIPGETDAEYLMVGTTVEETKTGWTFALSPSLEWLTSPDRVYPISIDPTIYPGESDIHAIKSDGATRTDSVLIGNIPSANKQWRTVLHYNYSSLAGKQVTGARISGIYSGEGTTATATGSVWTANGYGFANNAQLLDPWTVGAYGDTDNWGGVASKTGQMVSLGTFGLHLMLVGNETGGVNSFKSLDTTMAVDWKDFPAATTIATPTPTNGMVNAPIKPFMKMNASDPSGPVVAVARLSREVSRGPLRTEFERLGTTCVRQPTAH